MLNEKVICSICGEEIDVENARLVDGDPVCENCFYANYVKCHDCGEIVRIDDAIYINGEGYYVCEDCADEDYFKCDYCGEWHHNRDMYEVTNRGYTYQYCSDCTDRHAYYCKGCDEYHENYVDYTEVDGYNYCDDWLNDNAHYCNECNNWIVDDYYWDYNEGCCTKCSNGLIGDYHSHDLIFHYDDKIVDAYYKNCDDFSGLGIELEVDDGKNKSSCVEELNDILGNNAYYEKDGSLNNGFEIITNPHTLNNFWNIDFEKAFEVLKEYNFKSHNTSTCGLHIHFSKNLLGETEEEVEDNIAKLILFYDTFYNQLVKLSRRSAYNAEEWADKYSNEPKKEDFDKLKETVKYKRIARRSAVNIKNYNTIEFRLGRGTLVYNTFRAWIDLHIAFMKNVVNLSLDEVLDFSKMAKGIEDNTIDYIASKGLLSMLGGAE